MTAFAIIGFGEVGGAFARDLELAYRRMWEIWIAGGAPAPFALEGGP